MKSRSGSVNVVSAWAKVFPPAQEFGKRSDVFQILMPTAPTRIKLLPPLLQSFLFSPDLTPMNRQNNVLMSTFPRSYLSRKGAR